MKGRSIDTRMEKLIHGIVAVVLFGIVLGLSVCTGKQEKVVYKVVCFGDSVLGQTRDETSVTACLQENLQVPVFNGAFGGTRMSRLDQDRGLAFVQDGYSMAALAQSLAYGDFGMQQTIRMRDNGTFYFEETVDTLAEIDFQQVEVIFIQHGTNDYNLGISIENEEDLYDVYTFTGAIRSIIRTIRKGLPHVRIILVTPTYCWFHERSQTCEEWYTGYGYLSDYVLAEIKVAEEMGVEVIDNYNLFPHESWDDWLLYTQDGLHANAAGRQLIADAMAAYLEDNPR